MTEKDHPRMNTDSPTDNTFKSRVFTIVFKSDTPAGRLFDKVLFVAILLSLTVVMLDSIESISHRFRHQLTVLEWMFTVLFSIEYLLRIYCTSDKRRYIFSFFGLVDLISVLPTYLALVFPGLHALIDVRVLRLISVIRIFKLTAYLQEYQYLASALRASRRKILVFLSVVLMVVMVMGTLMYVVEGPENGFTSIPVAIYWGITTMTTVGFGDITPKTDLGRLLSSAMMLMGWGVLAVPTGVVTAELVNQPGRLLSPDVCPQCKKGEIRLRDNYCGHCGHDLRSTPS